MPRRSDRDAGRDASPKGIKPAAYVAPDGRQYTAADFKRMEANISKALDNALEPMLAKQQGEVDALKNKLGAIKDSVQSHKEQQNVSESLPQKAKKESWRGNMAQPRWNA